MLNGIRATIGYDISESCNPQPRFLSPGESVSTQLFLDVHTTHSLLVNVRNDSGTLLSAADVRLYRTPYDTTQTSSSCGQTFFSGLSEGAASSEDAYSIDVTASGYQSFTSLDDVDVSGASQLSIILDSI